MIEDITIKTIPSLTPTLSPPKPRPKVNLAKLLPNWDPPLRPKLRFRLPPRRRLLPASPAPPGTVTGASFTVHLTNSPLSALASPSLICDPNTTLTSAATLNMYFTYAFKASQCIVTPALGNHTNLAVIRYIGSACQVMVNPTQLPAIQETCISTAKSHPPTQVSMAHLDIADSGATGHFFR
jgi:hypothetical protein